MRRHRHFSLAAGAVSAAVAGLAFAAIAGCWATAPDSAREGDASNDSSLDLGDVIHTEAPTGDDGSGGDDGSSPGPDSGDGAPPGDGGSQGDGFVPPVVVPGAMPTRASGLGFACRVDSAGAVWCWGDNSFGQAGSPLGVATVAQATQVAGITGAVAVAAGDHHACAVTSNHLVSCWGLNAAYQLGHPAATSGDVICPGTVAGQTLPCSPVPAPVGAITDAVAIAAAGAWTCTLGSAGEVQCWGAVQSTPAPDGGVPCGAGTVAQGGTCYPAPYTVPGSTGVAAIAIGLDHGCAAVAGGVDGGDQVACWGNNNAGQVSPAACPAYDCTSLVTRTDLTSTVALAAGNQFSCALGVDQIVRCFGDNSAGELGHAPGTGGDLGGGDASVFNTTPTAVANLSGVTSVIGGGSQATCAIVAAGAVQCWGNLGAPTPTPTTIAGLPPMAGLGAFDGTLVCGQATDGSDWCFGLAGSPPAAQVQ
jgi:alpha-tubulin suppressor-like RCC1 family protein